MCILGPRGARGDDDTTRDDAMCARHPNIDRHGLATPARGSDHIPLQSGNTLTRESGWSPQRIRSIVAASDWTRTIHDKNYEAKAPANKIRSN